MRTTTSKKHRAPISPKRCRTRNFRPLCERLESRLALATTVDVDDDFCGTSITDADPVALGNQAAVLVVDAFTTIQAVVDAVEVGGTVKVNGDGPCAESGVQQQTVTITVDDALPSV